MLTIGNNKNTLDYNFDSFSDIGVDIKNLSLINDPSKTETRVHQYSILLNALSPNEFNLFHDNLSSEQKDFLNKRRSYKVMSNPLQNLDIPKQESQSKFCCIIALKHPNLARLIRDDNFKSDYKINFIYDIALLQSILMHNSQEVDEIRGITDLTPEQNEKRQQALKKIAIASLANEKLHEKSSEMLSGILPQEFNADDKNTIQTSINFLTASIKSEISSGNNEEAISQFNFLLKVLKVYGEKFNATEHNITLLLPENITKAMEEKKKFDTSIVITEDKETLSPKEFGEISPVAPILKKDNLGVISNQVILNALKERPSAMPAQGQANGPAGGSADRSV
jgi:hypothetical protein